MHNICRLKVYKNWQRANFNNGVFIRRETKGRWINSFEASYYHNINRSDQTIQPHGYPTDYLQTKYVSNVITLSYSLQYRLNKALKKVDNYIGLVYTRSFNSGQYSFHQISPVSQYSVPVSYDWNDNLLGINFLSKYSLSQKLLLTLDLSIKSTTRYLNQKNISDNGAGIYPYYRDPYTKPTTYLTCMLGISYMFNK